MWFSKTAPLGLAVLLKNEADIIGEHIRYHFSQGVDYIVAIDHNSTDASPAILKQLQQVYPGRLAILHKQGGFHQAQYMKEAADWLYQEKGCQWCLLSDADEFWLPLQGSLKVAVQKAAYSKAFPYWPATVLNTHMFHLLPYQTKDGPLDYRAFKLGTFAKSEPIAELEGANINKIAVFTPWLKRLYAGNHAAKTWFHREATVDIIIFHYHVRSYAAYQVKAQKALEARSSMAAEEGVGWKALEQGLNDNTLAQDWERLMQQAREKRSQGALATLDLQHLAQCQTGQVYQCDLMHTYFKLSENGPT